MSQDNSAAGVDPRASALTGHGTDTAEGARQVLPGEIAARIDRMPLSPVQWELATLTQIAWGIILATDGIAAILYPFIWAPAHVVTSFQYSLVYAFEVGIGILIGDYTMGLLADKIGRRPVLIISTILAGLFIWPFGYITSFPLLLIFSILLTLGVGGVLAVNVVYLTEMVSPAIRGKVTLGSQVVAVVIFTFLTGFVPHYMIPGDYRQFLFLLAGLQFVVLLPLLVWRLPESPRWLEAKGRVDEARRVLERLEDRCRRHAGELPEPDLTVHEVVSAEHVGIFEVFQGRYRWRTILLLICWILGYGGIVYGSGAYRLVFLASRGYSAGFIFMLGFVSGLIGAAALGINALVGDRLERKTGIVIGAILFAGGWYGLYNTTNTAAVEVLYTVMAVGTVLWLWNMYGYTPNAFATRIRAVGTGWTDGLGHMGAWAGVVIAGAVFTAASPLGWILLITIPGALAPAGLLQAFGLRQRRAVLERLSR